MLDSDVRTAILELSARGISKHQIARTLGLSRGTIRKIIRSGSKQVPAFDRTVKAEPFRDDILELHATCRGNLVRVHEELVARGAELSYQALTAFCRRHGIGVTPAIPVGEYTFAPGEEMQHDTSPHHATIAGTVQPIQTAGGVLGFSRMVFHQCYPRFRRFECKLFLDDAATYFDGVAGRCMIDNTHVVALHGTGASMVVTPEMEAFSKRYGFTFAAHEAGDANRSALVERSFSHFENNFLAGRTFESWEDIQRRAIEWCDRKNGTYKRHLKASPRELFAIEHAALRRLPLHRPKPSLLHHRTVDSRGFVALETNRYSVPTDWIGRPVEVQETRDAVWISLDRRHPAAQHARVVARAQQTLILEEHRGQRRSRRPTGPHRELSALTEILPELASYAQALLEARPKQPTIAIRHLLRMAREYPREPLLAALGRAHFYGLFDLARVERMVLAAVASDFFQLDDTTPDDPEDDS